MSRPVRTLFVLAVLFVLGACNRAPAEPISATADSTSLPTTSTVGTTSQGAATKRCVIATPANPPPKASAAPAGKCPPDPQGGPPFAKVATVSIPEASASVEVELALTDAETERGLMYRTSMPDGHGMLFAMEERKRQTFWMHNTCIPLDMMFIDDDGLIVGIAENVPTLSDDVTSVACPSSYVLEVNAGWSRAHGVRAGQKALLPPARPAH